MIPILALSLTLSGSSTAQLDGTDRGIDPYDSASNFEVGGVQVDVRAANGEAARSEGWRRAQILGWRMLWARPGIDRALHEVAGAVIDAGIEPHIGYSDQGETMASLLNPLRDERGRARLSCRCCIFSQAHHIHHALDARPAVMGPAVRAIQDYERESGYTWQQRGPFGVACTA